MIDRLCDMEKIYERSLAKFPEFAYPSIVVSFSKKGKPKIGAIKDEVKYSSLSEKQSLEDKVDSIQRDLKKLIKRL